MAVFRIAEKVGWTAKDCCINASEEARLKSREITTHAVSCSGEKTRRFLPVESKGATSSGESRSKARPEPRSVGGDARRHRPTRFRAIHSQRDSMGLEVKSDLHLGKAEAVARRVEAGLPTSSPHLALRDQRVASQAHLFTSWVSLLPRIGTLPVN